MLDFNDIKVSTQTYIVRSNLQRINLDKIMSSLCLTDNVLSITYQGVSRGDVVKKKKKKGPKGNNFLNCVTLSIMVEKKINVKIFNNGVFQLTGCKCYDHARTSVIVIWNTLKPLDCIEGFKSDGGYSKGVFEAYIISAMRNVDFILGFEVDRERLGNHITNNTTYKVTPMVNVFMGVKITIPLETIKDLVVYRTRIDLETNKVTETEDVYERFLTEVEVNPAKLKEPRSISISVFQTGKVLMSGIDFMYQVGCYNWFVNTIQNIKDDIEIKKKEKKTFRKSKFAYKTLF